MANAFATAPAAGGAGAGAEPRLAEAELERRVLQQGYAVVRVMPETLALALGRQVATLYPGGVSPNQPQSNWYLGLIDPDRALAIAGAKLMWDSLVPRLERLFESGRCHFASVAIKPPGAAATPMHQHWPTTVDPFARRIGCWVLLTGADPGARTFRLVPRSHQLLPFVRHPGSGDYFDGFSEAIDRDYAVDIPLRPGEALVFEDSILHGTRSNSGATMRVAGIASFVGATMGTATILPDGAQAFAVLDADRNDGMTDYLRTGIWPGNWRRVGTIPNRNRAISEREWAALLEGGWKASLDHDPLDLVRTPGGTLEDQDRARVRPVLSVPGAVTRLLARLGLGSGGRDA